MKNEEKNEGLEIINDLVGKIKVMEGHKKERGAKGLDLIDPEYITFTVTKTERIKI